MLRDATLTTRKYVHPPLIPHSKDHASLHPKPINRIGSHGQGEMNSMTKESKRFHDDGKIEAVVHTNIEENVQKVNKCNFQYIFTNKNT